MVVNVRRRANLLETHIRVLGVSADSLGLLDGTADRDMHSVALDQCSVARCDRVDHLPVESPDLVPLHQRHVA